jgi:D-glycero-D-manno-heptose 1,7-bisphosphate phosphatase
MRAVFLDRDGVINKNAPIGDYIKSVGELEVLPGVADAIRLLNESGFRVIVVSNQRGVGRGMMTAGDVEEIHGALLDELARSGARIDAVYYCPHEENTCDCRKPAIGMFRRALEDFPEIEIDGSVMVGDSPRDVEAARALSLTPIFIAYSDEDRTCASEHGIAVAESLLAAVERFIVPSD